MSTNPNHLLHSTDGVLHLTQHACRVALPPLHGPMAPRPRAFSGHTLTRMHVTSKHMMLSSSCTALGCRTTYAYTLHVTACTTARVAGTGCLRFVMPPLSHPLVHLVERPQPSVLVLLPLAAPAYRTAATGCAVAVCRRQGGHAWGRVLAQCQGAQERPVAACALGCGQALRRILAENPPP